MWCSKDYNFSQLGEFSQDLKTIWPNIDSGQNGVSCREHYGDLNIWLGLLVLIAMDEGLI